jgi:hypothetical protein
MMTWTLYCHPCSAAVSPLRNLICNPHWTVDGQYAIAQIPVASMAPTEFPGRRERILGPPWNFFSAWCHSLQMNRNGGESEVRHLPRSFRAYTKFHWDVTSWLERLHVRRRGSSKKKVYVILSSPRVFSFIHQSTLAAG